MPEPLTRRNAPRPSAAVPRGILVAVAAAACSSGSPNAPQTFAFGPFVIQPSQEISDQCVQITLHNADDLYINSVDLETGPGFHHSNWLWVPEHVFPGPHGIDDCAADDGTYTCADRGFDQAIAAIYGGVLFAQSTQVQHEVQTFPPGMAVKIPAHSKLVATIHLLNPGDQVLDLSPTITLAPIAEAAVTTTLHGIAFENHALGLPPNAQSKFTLDCDLAPADQSPPGNWPTPAFKIYYALAHYHALGTGLELDALEPDDTTSTEVFETTAAIGDSLGGPVDPPFDMTGYTRLRFSCSYYNDTASVVTWGLGNQEMCVFLAFTDSLYNWGGGETTDEPPGDPTDVDGVMSYTQPCAVFADPAN